MVGHHGGDFSRSTARISFSPSIAEKRDVDDRLLGYTVRLRCDRTGSWTRDGTGGWVFHPDPPYSRRGASSAISETPSSRRSEIPIVPPAASPARHPRAAPRVLFPLPVTVGSDTADYLPLHLLRGPSSCRKNNEETASVDLGKKKKSKRRSAGQRAVSLLIIEEKCKGIDPRLRYRRYTFRQCLQTARRALDEAMRAVASTANISRSTQQRAAAALKAAKIVAKESRKRVMANERVKKSRTRETIANMDLRLSVVAGRERVRRDAEALPDSALRRT